MKKKFGITFLLTLLCALCAMLCACSLFPTNAGGNQGDPPISSDDSPDNDKWSKAELISIGSAVPEGDEIFILVGTSARYNLNKRVEVSEGATWKVYRDENCYEELKDGYLEQPGGSLYDGNNVFYLKVSSSNMRKRNVYKLTAYRSYYVSVKYYDGDEQILEELAYTAQEFTPTYKATLTGYTFDGWCDEEGNAFISCVVWGGLNLFVAKTAITYKATLDANGVELEKTEQFIDYDDDFTLPVLERFGYTFEGWYLSDTQVTDETGKSLSVWNFTEDTALTAKWKPKKYTLTIINEDPAAGRSSAGGLYDYNLNSSVFVEPNDGYTFLGWFDEDGELLSQDLRFYFTMGTDRTLIVKWGRYTLTIDSEEGGKVSPLYTVSFDLNGGKGTTPDEQTVSAFQPLNYPKTKAPTREGHMFRGWFASATATDESVPYDFSAPIEGDLTLYAGWYAYPKTDGRSIMTVNDTLNTTVGLYGSSPDSHRFVFFCAYTTGEYTLTYTSSKADFREDAVSMRLFNKMTNGRLFFETFRDTETHTEKFALDAGTVYCLEVWRETYSVETHNIALTLTSKDTAFQDGGTAVPMQAQVLTRAGTKITFAAQEEAGYAFDGWYDETGALVSTELILDIIMPYESKIYTAKWRPIE